MQPSGPAEAWTSCRRGHRHWGRYGAAGLLMHAPTSSGPSVLLQHRSPHSHEGGTWGIPGGARHQDEDARTAALREAVEETDIDLSLLVVGGAHTDDHGGWDYVTVLAALSGPGPLPDVSPRGWESLATAWVPLDEVARWRLHPGFAASWPAVRALLRTGRPGD